MSEKLRLTAAIAATTASALGHTGLAKAETMPSGHADANKVTLSDEQTRAAAERLLNGQFKVTDSRNTESARPSSEKGSGLDILNKVEKDYIKTMISFLEAVKNSREPQELYNSVLVMHPRPGTKGVVAQPAAIPNPYNFENTSIMEIYDSKPLQGDNAVCGIAGPIYKKFKGQWYVFGWDYGGRNQDMSDDLSMLDVDPLEYTLKHFGHLSDSALLTNEEFFRRLKIYPLKTLEKEANLEFWGLNGAKPKFVQTESIDGKFLYTKAAPGVMPSVEPGVYFGSDSQSRPQYLDEYQNFLIGLGFKQLPYKWRPELPS